MSRALAFLADPALAAAVLPAPGSHSTCEFFLHQAGHPVPDRRDQRRGRTGRAAVRVPGHRDPLPGSAAGSRMPGGRLDPPLLMALDEVTQICPVPVPSWLADSGGKGIQIITVAHGEAQLRGRWGPTAPASSWTPPARRSGCPASATPTRWKLRPPCAAPAPSRTRPRPPHPPPGHDPRDDPPAARRPRAGRPRRPLPVIARLPMAGKTAATVPPAATGTPPPGLSRSPSGPRQLWPEPMPGQCAWRRPRRRIHAPVAR